MKPVQAALLLAAIVSVCFFVNLPPSQVGSAAPGAQTLAARPVRAEPPDCGLDLDASRVEELIDPPQHSDACDRDEAPSRLQAQPALAGP